MKCGLHTTWAIRRRDDGVRRMAGTQGADEGLLRQHLDARLSRKDVRFHDDFVGRCGSVAASGDAGGGVDDSLDLVGRGRRDVRAPDRGGKEK